MARCGSSNCDASQVQVSWEPVPGYAGLFSEGTVVQIDIDHPDMQLKYNAAGTEVSRVGKQAREVTVTIRENKCSAWGLAVYNAWANDVFECGSLILNTNCCLGIIKVNFAVVEPNIPDIEVDANNPVEIVFKGILDKAGNYSGGVGIGNQLILT